MKQIKFKLAERIEYTRINHHEIYDVIRDRLDDTNWVVEILNFNEIPTGYLPPVVDPYVLTNRILTAIEVLGPNSPGYNWAPLRGKTVVWFTQQPISSVRRRFRYQLENGAMIEQTIKVTAQNITHHELFCKYVLQEGGNEAGKRIEVASE
ncbi:hypothetical protein PHABIO_384 [Pseudomonas phage Phabio]|uniref:Uncharacterized protein n=1 Tax=Pseudomonas phage Phabio TaxID=2006668 RepID=A0A1Y0SWY2_9CAUD|nr:hypothetical protein MZD05_gp384 [Pseudomonas phage Phabio]ARV77015.1 hypothetical protein PHABIO_384 [Pseudomonas phage Phabio]